jgi:hypothetical protein
MSAAPLTKRLPPTTDMDNRRLPLRIAPLIIVGLSVLGWCALVTFLSSAQASIASGPHALMLLRLDLECRGSLSHCGWCDGAWNIWKIGRTTLKVCPDKKSSNRAQLA